MEEFHPPSSVLPPRILQKVRGDKTTFLLVVSTGQDRAAMVRTDPAATDTCTVPTAQVKSLLSLPSDQEAVHLLWRSLNLTVWSISGEPIMQPVSLQK